MFCPRCGKELPDGSQFCLKCGQSLAAGAQTTSPREPIKSSTRNVWGILAVLVAIAIMLAIGSKMSQSVDGSPNVTAVPKVLPLPRTQAITNGAATVKAAGYVYYKFTVPPGATAVSVDGHFTATGGTGNDIEAFVLGEDAFVNFQNGHSTPTYYNSGKVTQNSIYAALPSGGTYYLIFNNNFSLITPKAVEVNALLHYTN